MSTTKLKNHENYLITLSPPVIKEEVKEDGRDTSDDDPITEDDLKFSWHVLE